MRLTQLLDEDSFEERDAGLVSEDPLGFVDQKAYPDRVAAAQLATGLRDAAVWGFGRIEGQRIAIVVMDFGFMGGSMGAVVGEKVARAAEAALDERVPLVVVSASGGARMQEGTLALMQLAKTMAALERLRAARVPYVSVMSDPTTGGVFASYAAMGDVNLAEPNALIGFAGARVGAGTIGQELPPGFQRSEFLFRHGFVDRVVAARRTCDASWPRSCASSAPAAGGRPWLTASATAAARQPRRASPRPTATVAPVDEKAAVWARVQLARNLRRPRILEFLAEIADEFVELHGDRLFGDDEAIVAGFARIDGRRVVVVGQQKGADTEENVRRNFGMPHPEGYRKAMRVMELAERCGLPVVTFVDVPGAHPGPGVGGAGDRRGHRALGRPDDPPADPDRDRDHRRGRLRRRARDRRRRRRAGPRERGLLGDLARGLREHPVADHGRGGDRGPGDADERGRPAARWASSTR